MVAAQEAAQKAAQQLETLETLSCKNLKLVLAGHNVSFEGVVEKEELLTLARRALTDVIGANEVEDGDGDGAKDSGDGACPNEEPHSPSGSAPSGVAEFAFVWAERLGPSQ